MKKFLFLFLALLAAPVMADPVSAGFAIYSMYAGAAAVAVATATAAELVIGGMMIAGGAMSLAGNVTGNSNLMKYGGIVSAVGGIANMANGAGSVASAATEEGGGMQLGAGGAAGAGSEAGGAVTSPVSPGGDVTQANLRPPDLAASGGDATQANLGQSDLATPGGEPPPATNTGLIDSASAAPEANATQGTEISADSAPGGGAEPTGQMDASQGASPTQQNPMRVQERNLGVAGSDGAAPNASSGDGKGLADYLRQGTDFLKNNKEVTQIGGKMLQGAMDDKERRAAQQRIWDHEAALRAQYNQSVAGSRVGQTFNRNVALGPRVPAPQPTPGA